MTNGREDVMDDEQLDKVRENKLRRMAERQGLKVIKSRRRDPRAVDYGRYWLVEVQGPGGDARSRLIVAGGDFGLSMDELEDELNGRRG